MRDDRVQYENHALSTPYRGETKHPNSVFIPFAYSALVGFVIHAEE